MHLEANTAERMPGIPRKNWTDSIRRGLKETGMSWEEEEENCANSRLAVTYGPLVFDTG